MALHERSIDATANLPINALTANSASLTQDLTTSGDIVAVVVKTTGTPGLNHTDGMSGETAKFGDDATRPGHGRVNITEDIAVSGSTSSTVADPHWVVIIADFLSGHRLLQQSIWQTRAVGLPSSDWAGDGVYTVRRPCSSKRRELLNPDFWNCLSVDNL